MLEARVTADRRLQWFRDNALLPSSRAGQILFGLTSAHTGVHASVNSACEIMPVRGFRPQRVKGRSAVVIRRMEGEETKRNPRSLIAGT